MSAHFISPRAKHSRSRSPCFVWSAVEMQFKNRGALGTRMSEAEQSSKVFDLRFLLSNFLLLLLSNFCLGSIHFLKLLQCFLKGL